MSRTLSFDSTEEHAPEDLSQSMINTPVPVRFFANRRKRAYRFNVREPAVNELSDIRLRRLRNAERTDNPFEEYRVCCKKKQCFLKVNKVHAFHWYREIMSMNREEAKTTLLTWYNAGHRNFEFDGRSVCWRFLNKAFEFSNDLLSAVKNTEGARAAQTAFAQPRNYRRPTLRDSIINFLRVTSESLGDEMPHRSFSNLPMYNKAQVYQFYIMWYNAHDPMRFSRSPPSISTFYSVWKQHVPDVKLMKNIGFEKCAECVFYGEQRAKYMLNPTKLREIKDASRQHYVDVASERRGYELRKLQSCREPKHYLSLVIDGADQSSYGLPHFLQKSKEDKGHKIAVKIVGVLMHGVENDLYLFSMVEGFETGANHVIESLHRALDRKKRKLGMLPPTLFVQADNCTRENKNRFFLGYLEMLVARGVFVEVQMSSLEVGHTHTDVDQAFSCVHRRLDCHAAFSLDQLHRQLKKCFTPAPHVEELSRIVNFSKQCETNNILTKASNFTQYRYFRLIRSSNEANVELYKTKCLVKRSLSEEWKELPGARGSGFLTTAPDILNFPKTKTRELPNVREVNLCLRAAETRIRDRRIMDELYDLRDRVYTPQEYEGHWNYACFELMGDYAPDSQRTEINDRDMPQSDSEEEEGDFGQRFRYDVGDFVAVKPDTRYKTPFWIREVTGFGEIDVRGYPKVLEIRWYTTGAGDDPLSVTYKPGLNGNRPWIATIHVDTIMLRFGGLTRRNRLSRETANKLSRGLGASCNRFHEN